MRHALLIAVGLTVAGCATATPPAQVTRFHQLSAATAPAARIAPGSFRIIAPARSEGTPSPEWSTYAAAVQAELRRLGLDPVAPNAAPGSESYRVTVAVDRADRMTNRGSGVGVGVGGSTGSFGSGVGVGVGLDLTRLLGGGEPDTALRLAVRIEQSGGAAIWEGRAETAVRSRAPAGQPGIAAARLAQALFADFPGRSGQTISVP
ncbi:MAG: hypothetical protein MUF41_06610 [Sphingopyxis sp.]|jgi:hypothetical protein|nr:hypothetical protein [Sphingopyxis sp.]